MTADDDDFERLIAQAIAENPSIVDARHRVAPRLRVKQIATNGQICLGVAYAGRIVQIEQHDNGILLRFVALPQPKDSG